MTRSLCVMPAACGEMAGLHLSSTDPCRSPAPSRVPIGDSGAETASHLRRSGCEHLRVGDVGPRTRADLKVPSLSPRVFLAAAQKASWPAVKVPSVLARWRASNIPLLLAWSSGLPSSGFSMRCSAPRPATGQPPMAGDLPSAVVDSQFGSGERDGRPGVEFHQTLHLSHRDEVVAADVAHLAFDAAPGQCLKCS